MIQKSSLHWSLTKNTNTQDLLDKLAAHFELRTEQLPSQAYTLLDNFENTLWHKGIRLLSGQGQFILSLAQQQIAETATTPPPRFWWDFPDGAIRSVITKPLGYWSLSKITEFTLTTKKVDLLNEDQKTVVQLNIIYCKANSENPGRTYLSLKPYRGYDQDFKLAAGMCHNADAEPIPNANLWYFLEQQQPPIKAAEKQSFDIDKNQHAEQAIYNILAKVLPKARTYEHGIIKDIDTEFLHQYRVSLRQARSLINLMRPALPKLTQLSLKQKLAQIAGKTNLLRDLDVFLLNKDNYIAMLPQDYEKGLAELFSLLEAEREKTFKQTRSFFNSKQYQNLFAETLADIPSTALFESDASKQSILNLAKKCILKRHKKVCTLGLSIDKNTPDDDVHELRIECKKLRYLMAFFAELFPQKPINRLIKPLKNLQTILGDFNDYSVQQEFLRERLERTRSTKFSSAVHGLIGVLHQKQLKEKASVMSSFQAFADETTTNAFKELFSA